MFQGGGPVSGILDRLVADADDKITLRLQTIQTLIGGRTIAAEE